MSLFIGDIDLSFSFSLFFVVSFSGFGSSTTGNAGNRVIRVMLVSQNVLGSVTSPNTFLEESVRNC